MRRIPRTHRRSRLGAAALEFAVVLPVLILVVLGCIDFGRVAHSDVTLSNAVGAGTAYAATHRVTPETHASWSAAIREIVLEEMQNLREFDESRFEIASDFHHDPGGDVVVVIEATYPFETAVVWPGLPHAFDLRQRVVAMQYR
ncbi:MAG: TadE/TadG family type IV pilus assembly protein [Planctomycetaceae bacterium]